MAIGLESTVKGGLSGGELSGNGDGEGSPLVQMERGGGAVAALWSRERGREAGALPWLGGGACRRLGLQAVHGRRGRDGGEANGAGGSVAWSRGDGSGGAFSNWARGIRRDTP